MISTLLQMARFASEVAGNRGYMINMVEFMQTIRSDEPLAIAIVQAIRNGDLEKLTGMLRENPSLAAASIIETGNRCGERTLLHVATDWPGHFPNGAATVGELIAHGADINARFVGAHTETPLHWAAELVEWLRGRGGKPAKELR